MCFYVITYTDWQCGYRQHTGRHRVECARPNCRMSNRHPINDHNCEGVCISAVQQEEQHLIMEENRDVCSECRQAGRGEGEHPRTEGANGVNGHSGAIQYRRIIT
ncbi:uncharacterized protein TRAVEDRAFT_47320 [Trametes versicolor FP-101664 SS1]|uniref:uncharacterized protein n=1 Tax=Trametes versicolor (strain FP-101664) TaxID=717944 RepID=UPI00046220CB|nr:uncharacterized protein TRAVEDRAFT_47320 [Trametes versicolor FP-101664 SS1]EIW58142.1 hypothetical protein TRAVEDRAFT_47320 [Trametes versicolor FP-101664 SS1]